MPSSRITYRMLCERIEAWNKEHGFAYRNKGYLKVTNDGPVHLLGRISRQGGTGLSMEHGGDGTIRSCYEQIPHLEP